MATKTLWCFGSYLNFAKAKLIIYIYWFYLVNSNWWFGQKNGFFVHNEFVLEHRTLNEEYYTQVYHRLWSKIVRLNRSENPKGKELVLFHDNASSHKTVKVRKKTSTTQRIFLIYYHAIIILNSKLSWKEPLAMIFKSISRTFFYMTWKSPGLHW